MKIVMRKEKKIRDPEKRAGENCEEEKKSWTRQGRGKRPRREGVNHLLVTCYMPGNHLTSVVIAGEGEEKRPGG